jgi:hypothetical protein
LIQIEKIQAVPDPLSFHVLPDDPVEALNVLREAAGLEPLPEDETDED